MVSKKIIDFIKRHEGLRLEQYNDLNGYPTIGYGHRPQPDEFLSCLITQEKADELLNKDMDKAILGVRGLVSNFDDLVEPRQAVLIDMCYNMGMYGLSQFHRTLQAIKEGEFSEAASYMRASLWYHQVKNRSLEDSDIMETGEWQ